MVRTVDHVCALAQTVVFFRVCDNAGEHFGDRKRCFFLSMEVPEP